MEQPLITIYAPTKRKGRWVTRADINARGQLVELQATASDALARRARDWYNTAADFLGQYISYAPQPAAVIGQRARPVTLSTPPTQVQAHAPPPGREGVFADLPVLSYQLAEARRGPHDESIHRAAELVYGAGRGDAEAIKTLATIGEKAKEGDEDAVDAFETITVVSDAILQPEALDMPAVIHAANAGERCAQKQLAALEQLCPPVPTLLEISMDDYEHADMATIASDLILAVADEEAGRVSAPYASTLQQVDWEKIAELRRHLPMGTTTTSIRPRTVQVGRHRLPVHLAPGKLRRVRPSRDIAISDAFSALLSGAA